MDLTYLTYNYSYKVNWFIPGTINYKFFSRYTFYRLLFYYMSPIYNINLNYLYLTKNYFKNLNIYKIKLNWYYFLFNLNWIFHKKAMLEFNGNTIKKFKNNIFFTFIYYYLSCLQLNFRKSTALYLYCFNNMANSTLIKLRYIARLAGFKYRWVGSASFIFNICYLIVVSLHSLAIKGIINIITFLFMRFRYRRQNLLFKFISYILKILIAKLDLLHFVRGFYVQLRGKIGRGGSARRLKLKNFYQQYHLKNMADKILCGYQPILTIEGSMGLRINIIYV